MSNKNKVEDTSVSTDSTQATEPTGKQEVEKNSRCAICRYCNVPAHVGEPSVSEQIKSMWHTQGEGLSLKQFAKALVSKGDKLAKEWLAHKHGSLNEQRSEKNKARASLESQATKAARKKKKAQGGKATDATAAVAAK